ncbi:hypothetical protein CONCODRAFT_11423 [Conidiobolus coronatus NRRL 28638]|uniref:Acyl-protein thioesterase 1 n=1 Tax=Conidiobolus coronatus (strain ATCC 28846 / CBS 209.66 / NRRL 28638) TaxID=796925 RepID=A0A137NV67_CONC2|nr:hypothetical protein CONCODRAFT_11423 [Conidiobolus coronatus NRRL 28638]|eukprot:KXN66666.1 hypothetical protein CONCODRAFT_11423 [Conidiobolus coronatus NRRL 28638]
MAVESLDVITLKSIGKHTSTIIWLHGLGESRDGWTDIDLNLRKKFSSSKFIFPIAPIRNNGFYGNRELPSWFNVTCRENIGKIEDPKGLNESTLKN